MGGSGGVSGSGGMGGSTISTPLSANSQPPPGAGTTRKQPKPPRSPLVLPESGLVLHLVLVEFACLASLCPLRRKKQPENSQNRPASCFFCFNLASFCTRMRRTRLFS
eukprot:3174434-Rhodomonas_salina.2